MDFVQVMKDWRRMCKAFTTDDDSCCEGCPVVDFREHGCGAIFEMEDGTDWQRYSDTITAWAAEHPGPVYPTWEEWLLDNGVFAPDNVLLNGKHRFYMEGKPVLNIPTKKIYDRIPADIAQKLGIEPKEGT